jgi:hypothetical protein
MKLRYIWLGKVDSELNPRTPLGFLFKASWRSWQNLAHAIFRSLFYDAFSVTRLYSIDNRVASE